MDLPYDSLQVSKNQGRPKSGAALPLKVCFSQQLILVIDIFHQSS